MKKADEKRLSRAMIEYVKAVYESYIGKLDAVRSSGELSDLASYGVDSEDDRIVGFLNLLEYWKWIEEGREPGSFPNIDAIKRYIGIKPIIPRPFTLPSGRQVMPSENQLAYLLGQKIERDGIPMQPFLYESIKENRILLLEEMGKALKDEVMENLELEFNA